MASTEAKSCVVTESTIYRLKYKWTPTDLSNLKVERGQPGSKILIGSSECFEFNGSTFPLDVLQFNVKLYREVSKANIDFVSVSVFTIPNEGTGGTGTGGTVQCKIGMLDKENKVLDLPNLRSYGMSRLVFLLFMYLIFFQFYYRVYAFPQRNCVCQL